MKILRPAHAFFLGGCAALLVSLSSCASTGARDHHEYATDDGAPVEWEAMLDDLATHDVLFLGEEHDNTIGHELQLRTLLGLAERRADLVITLEQFEADVQDVLDLYLHGGISEREFLERSRPWGNYADHYRPIIEFAREREIPVIAANIPRPLARRVAYEGLAAVRGASYTPWSVWTEEERYADLFAEAMGRTHTDDEDEEGAEGEEGEELEEEPDEDLARWFSAQCIKDAKMAQSIAATLVAERRDGRDPLIVHLCGKFHSDYGLGTVSRLSRRLPGLDIAIVAMESDSERVRELTEDERARGDYLWLVPLAD